MSKFTILFFTLCVGVTATYSPTYASEDQIDKQIDPRGLLHVSSNLYEQMNEQPELHDDGGPSNTNIPKEAVVAEAQPVELTAADRKAALKYLFLKDYRNNPNLRELNSRVNVDPLVSLLHTLRTGGQMTANQINKKLVVDEKTTSYKLCQKHKANGFIQYDERSLRYSLTAKGQFVLETLEEHLGPDAGSKKKRSRKDDNEGEPSKAETKNSVPAQLKKPRESADEDSIESTIVHFKRPAAHLNILNAMGEPDVYQTSQSIFDNMAEKISKSPWEKAQYTFRDHYLKISLNHGWLKSKRTKTHELYTITEKGIEARTALKAHVSRLPKKASVVEVEEVEDEEEEWASYSLSSYEPAQEKRTRPSSSDVDDGQEDDDGDSSRRAKQAKSKPVVASKQTEPAPKKLKSAAPKKAAATPVRKAAEPVQPTLTLDTVPEALRTHLIEQVMKDDNVDLGELETFIFQGICDQFSKVLVEKFGIGPGNALKEEVEKSYTFSIKKK